MTAADRADSFLQLIRRAERGRLKIYLGYSAGVGKTYQMLQEAHRLKSEGVDVVIGIVETHGRVDTAALVNDLELIPRRKIEYHGVIMEEMDLQAILTRKPQVCLVDELAHTNLPGSTNAKRYQDVQDILDAGIHVISALNLQHLESLYHTVEKLINVKVAERLPDSVLAEADQVVNVDVTPEDLQKRLKAGKVYHTSRAATALDNFFTASNLEQLRELTLREVASQIDFKRREILEKERAHSPDQIMVCLSSRGPNSGVLLRYASRLAGRLNRNWYAVYVQTPSEDPVVIDSGTQRLLNDTLTLANQLGAMVFTFKGQDVVDTILRFANEYRVGHIVIGRPGALPLWKRLLGKTSVAERLIHSPRGISIVVIDADKRREEETPDSASAPPAAEQSPEERKPMPVTLSSLLGLGQVLIWERPVTRHQIFREIAKAAKLKDPTLDTGGLIQRLIEREDQGSTFLNEGTALPHVRMEALREFIAVLGIAHAGVSDVTTEKPVEIVLFLLSPEREATQHLQLLAAAARLLQDRRLRRRLIAYDTPEKVLAAVHEAERA
jgi:two-component system sensor histidine kinase KdpD